MRQTTPKTLDKSTIELFRQRGFVRIPGVITKDEFSRVIDGWETCRRGKCKCQFDCRNMRDEIFSLAAGVDLDLDKKITWNEFLSAVDAKRMTETGRSKTVMDQVR